MMDAVHRYEGTVNQVLGDGIMALFGAPIAHEDHAMSACYAALAMQEGIRHYSAEVRRSHGVELRIRVGLHSGQMVVRAIGNDLHMDYSAVGVWIPPVIRVTGLCLIVMRIGLLPANIYAAMHRVDVGGHGVGPAY
jgi:class 3 adenylate cyclase